MQPNNSSEKSVGYLCLWGNSCLRTEHTNGSHASKRGPVSKLDFTGVLSLKLHVIHSKW